jgi:hypothetical protein
MDLEATRLGEGHVDVPVLILAILSHRGKLA